jgi:hypothetical protein
MQNEAMRKLSRALAELRQAMKDRGMTPPEGRSLEDALRNYRPLQLSDEQIEQLLKALEELKKLIESGADIQFCKSGMGGLMGLGLGMGLGFGPPGLGRGSGLGMRGGPGGTGKGDDTGGAGQGRGGDPGMTPDGKTTSPDMIPGQASPDGDATLIRTTRKLPTPEEDPEAYDRLIREASLEAEEALRRGDIPRRYRGFVRRFFGSTEDE